MLHFDAEETFRLADGESQGVVWFVQPLEGGVAVVDVVFTLSEFEVDDVDGVYFTHPAIIVTEVDIVGDDLDTP